MLSYEHINALGDAQMSLVNSAAFSYFKDAKAMTAFISDLDGNPNANVLIEDINESQFGFRMRSERTGRVEIFIYIDTLYSKGDEHEGPEVQGWTFRPVSHSLQAHINLVTIYND